MTTGQTVRAAAFGVAFWLVAALTVHFFPALFDWGSRQIALFAVSIGIAWLSIRVAAAAIGVPVGQALDGVVVATIAATLLDGIALTWFSGLYSGVTAATQFGAAWILWGAGWILLFAYLARERG